MCLGILKRLTDGLNTWLLNFSRNNDVLPPLKRRHVGVKGLDGDVI